MPNHAIVLAHFLQLALGQRTDFRIVELLRLEHVFGKDQRRKRSARQISPDRAVVSRAPLLCQRPKFSAEESNGR